MRRPSLLAIALAPMLALSALAGPLDTIYDDADLSGLAPLYERGWRDNYESLFRPALDPGERAMLDGIRFHMEPRVPNAEPFAFMAGGGRVIVSAASIRFLEDMAMAHTWLDLKGYSTQSAADYLLILRYWKRGDGRPPRPWDALCIPADAFDDDEVAPRARQVFNTAVVFVLLHEYGHVLHRHPGNRAVAPAASRANEEEADRFAMDQFVRVGDMPVGAPLLFFVMAHLMESRADFSTEAAYRESLAARTHPLSPERLQALARHMSTLATSYDRNARPGAQVSALAIALEISQLAHLMADPGIHALSARIGRSARPRHLAPRPRGRHLAPPCGAPERPAGDFDGIWRGEISDGRTPLDLDVVMRRDGGSVTGDYSFGAGFGSFEGALDGSTLSYRWSLPPDSGRARLTLADGRYRGHWGYGDSDDDGGTIELRR